MRVPRTVGILGMLLCLTFAAARCDWSAPALDPRPDTVSAATKAAPASTAPSPSLSSTVQAANSAGNSLSAALAKAHSARSYRIALDITTAASSGDKSTRDVFLALDGIILGAASHITYSKGAFNDLLGGGDQIEIVNIEQRTYMRGNALFGGSEPGNWYVLPDSEMTRVPFDAWNLLTLSGIDSRTAHATSNETLDGMKCTAWTADFAANAIRLLELSAPQGATTDFTAIEQADARFVVCPDGYLHAMNFDVSAHIPDRPVDRNSTAIRLRLFDFNARTLSVAAPSGAIEVK